MREGAAARLLPERSRRADPALHCGAGRTARSRRSDWDTAIREVAARLNGVKDAHGGDTILYYGGGGQGNHLGGAYAGDAEGVRRPVPLERHLAQEKTGEALRERADARHTGARRLRALRGRALRRQEPVDEPWLPAGPLDAARRSPATRRASMVVIDPRRTETARSWPTIHLAGAPRPRRLAARRARCRDRPGRALSTSAGGASTRPAPRPAPGARRHPGAPSTAAISGVDEDLVRQRPGAWRPRERRRFEDLGTQMNRHSTLSSYLEKLVLGADRQLIARPSAASTAPASLVPLARASRGSSIPSGHRSPRSPAQGDRRADPLQRDPRRDPHRPPQALRALIVESRQPHPLARRQPAHARGDRAARHARRDRRVHDRDRPRWPTTCCRRRRSSRRPRRTFFNFEFPRNVFHLRHPVLPARRALPEPEIHARLVEASGALGDADLDVNGRRSREPRGVRRRLLRCRRGEPGARPARAGRAVPARSARPFRTGCSQPLRCGPSPTASPRCTRRAWRGPASATGSRPASGSSTILSSPSGVVFAVDDYDETWRRVADTRRQDPARPARPAGRAGRARHRAAAWRRPELAVPAVGRRAPLVHREHDHPRPERRKLIPADCCGCRPPTRAASASTTGRRLS